MTPVKELQFSVETAGQTTSRIMRDVTRRAPKSPGQEFASTNSYFEVIVGAELKKAEGLRWRKVDAKPRGGIELTNGGLRESLKQKNGRSCHAPCPSLVALLVLSHLLPALPSSEFSPEEWAKFDINDLRSNHYIIVKGGFLWRNKTVFVPEESESDLFVKDMEAAAELEGIEAFADVAERRAAELRDSLRQFMRTAEERQAFSALFGIVFADWQVENGALRVKRTLHFTSDSSPDTANVGSTREELLLAHGVSRRLLLASVKGSGAKKPPPSPPPSPPLPAVPRTTSSEEPKTPALERAPQNATREGHKTTSDSVQQNAATTAQRRYAALCKPSKKAKASKKRGACGRMWQLLYGSSSSDTVEVRLRLEFAVDTEVSSMIAKVNTLTGETKLLNTRLLCRQSERHVSESGNEQGSEASNNSSRSKKAVSMSVVFKGRTKELDTHKFSQELLHFVKGEFKEKQKERHYPRWIKRVFIDPLEGVLGVDIDGDGAVGLVDKSDDWSISAPMVEADKEHHLKLRFTIVTPSNAAAKFTADKISKLLSERLTNIKQCVPRLESARCRASARLTVPPLLCAGFVKMACGANRWRRRR